LVLYAGTLKVIVKDALQNEEGLCKTSENIAALPNIRRL
jgi:hypothetical protein